MTTTDTAANDTATVAYPYVATVHRPGLPDVHLGFHSERQAENAAWSLRSDFIDTMHVPGSTVSFSATPAGVSVLGPLPRDRSTLAELIAAEANNQPDGHAFPDLLSQLEARHGYQEAMTIWRAARAYLNIEETPAARVIYRYVTTVHRPGLPDVHLGMETDAQARGAARSLTEDMRTVPHIPGTSITWSPMPDGVCALPFVPLGCHELGDLIEQQDPGVSRAGAFPDLFARIKALQGFDTADQVWNAACFALECRDECDDEESDVG